MLDYLSGVCANNCFYDMDLRGQSIGITGVWFFFQTQIVRLSRQDLFREPGWNDQRSHSISLIHLPRFKDSQSDLITFKILYESSGKPAVVMV